MVTFALTLFFAPHLEEGILIGVLLSLILFLFRSMRPRVAELTEEMLAEFKEQKVKSFEILDIDHVTTGAFMRNTLKLDKNSNRQEALMDIYRVMRPGEPPTPEAADVLFSGLFFLIHYGGFCAVHGLFISFFSFIYTFNVYVMVLYTYVLGFVVMRGGVLVATGGRPAPVPEEER